ncbi:uncharacterized protein LOC126471181 [Schistocerca serialis cubense]|uniref:uncharacterized protein LOC126471181 n=1 Tax=Schistocerca serialis cubense TaxID=2023355 RepID=UPI00214EE169|nr:uncharacterized protein LOC126471181 [Schistocerca serialis cubense]
MYLCCHKEKVAGLCPAGVRPPMSPSQLSPSLPLLLGSFPSPLKAPYTEMSLCNSSITSHEHGSEKHAATIQFTHKQSSTSTQISVSPHNVLADTACPNAPKPLYTAVSVCNSSFTLHEGDSEKHPTTMRSIHQQSFCTRKEQAWLRQAGVRQPPPLIPLGLSLGKRLGRIPTASEVTCTTVSQHNSVRSSYEEGSEKSAAIIGSPHKKRSCTREVQAELRHATVKQPPPLIPLGLSLGRQLRPVPTASEDTSTTVSLHNTASSSYEEGSEKSPAIIGSPHQKSSCTGTSTSHEFGSEKGAVTIGSSHQPKSCMGEEQAGLWPVGVSQPVPSSQLAPSLPPQLGQCPIPQKVKYMVTPVCNSATEGAATIGSTHEHGSSTGEEQAGLWPAGVRQPVTLSQLDPSLPPQRLPPPILRKPMYTVSPVCNSSRTSHDGGSTEGAVTIGSTHEHGSNTGEEQAGLWPAVVRQPVPPSQLAPSLPPQLGRLPVPRKAMYTVSSVCNSSTVGAATIGSTHEHRSSTGEVQGGLWRAGVRQPEPPSQLAPSLPEHLGSLPVPRKAMYMVSAVCNSSTEAAAIIGSTHYHGSNTGDEQAGLWPAGVRQPVAPSKLAPSRPPQLGRRPIPRNVMYTVSSVCNSATEGAATIGSTHEHGSNTGEEQAGLWPAGIRQPVPPSTFAPSLPSQLGQCPIPQKVMYIVSSVCNSATEGAATIGSTHERGSNTGEKQAGLWPAGVRQPVPSPQLASSLPPQLGQCPIPRKVMYMVSPVCNSATEGAATIGSTHEHGSNTGEEQAGLWPAGVRQPVPSFQLAPSLPPQRGPLPNLQKAMYMVSPLCNSSRTSHDGGSTEGVATIGSTHGHGSSTGEEKVGLWPAGVRQPVPPSQLAPSLPPQLGQCPIPRKVMYMVSPVCNSTTEGAATIGSTHEHGSSTGEEQAGPWPAGVRQPIPPFQVAPSLPPQLGPLPIPRKAKYTLSSVCKSSSTSHDGGSIEGATTISSTHEYGSSTG